MSTSSKPPTCDLAADLCVACRSRLQREHPWLIGLSLGHIISIPAAG